MKLLQIKWRDACGGDGWEKLDYLKNQKPIIHTSVGYVVNETKDFITITMGVDETKEEYGAWLLIPKAYIIKKQYVSSNKPVRHSK